MQMYRVTNVEIVIITILFRVRGYVALTCDEC